MKESHNKKKEREWDTTTRSHAMRTKTKTAIAQSIGSHYGLCKINKQNITRKKINVLIFDVWVIRVCLCFRHTLLRGYATVCSLFDSVSLHILHCCQYTWTSIDQQNSHSIVRKKERQPKYIERNTSKIGMVNVHIDIHFLVYGRSSMFPYSWPIFDSMFYHSVVSFFSFTVAPSHLTRKLSR